MQTDAALSALGVSLGLGLLVGLQRERVQTHQRLAGIRTFPLICVLGAMTGLLSGPLGGWVVGAGMLAVSAALLGGNLLSAPRHEGEPGITTEIAALVMFMVGVTAALGEHVLAAGIGAGVAALLHAKTFLHGVAQRLGERDVHAVVQFAVITFVVLPVLPDEPLRAAGPLSALNPRQVWLMVVLVTGLSLAGYIAHKFLGGSRGAMLSGLLGGLISSTATSVSWARRAAGSPDLAGTAALVMALASCVLHARLLVEIAAAAPDHLRAMGTPIAVLLVVQGAVAAGMWSLVRGQASPPGEHANPSELRTALLFAGAFALVTLAAAAAQRWTGPAGLFALAGVSGLTDMDAITLSVSALAQRGEIAPGLAWRAIVVASMSNALFKAVLVGVLGGRAVGARVAVMTAITLAAGGTLLVLL